MSLTKVSNAAASTANTPYDYVYKLIIIGDSGIGKSALLKRFSDQKYNDVYTSTIGVDFRVHTIIVDGLICRLQIWDTAGQERFRTITSAYYKGAHGIIIVYDITNPDTFTNCDMWLKEVEKNAHSQAIKILVGTKSDLAEHRNVSLSDAQLFADKHCMKYIEVSSKSNHNVDDVFITIARQLCGSLQLAPTSTHNNSNTNANTNANANNTFNNNIKYQTIKVNSNKPSIDPYLPYNQSKCC